MTKAPAPDIVVVSAAHLPDEPADAGPHRYVGQPVPRYGGADRTTGAQRFLADLRFPGALQVVLVTVPVGCAEILDIDTSLARTVAGVVDVVTAVDLPSPMPRFGPTYQDRPVLAVGQVNHHGEPVAAVVAETRDAADAAARAVHRGNAMRRPTPRIARSRLRRAGMARPANAGRIT